MGDSRFVGSDEDIEFLDDEDGEGAAAIGSDPEQFAAEDPGPAPAGDPLVDPLVAKVQKRVESLLKKNGGAVTRRPKS